MDFRLFVSSTFADMQVEREALRTRVFPRLRALCQALGGTFHAVDLRWGVSREAAEDQRTMRICLEEVERCKAAGKPYFVTLLGQRYGWRPLPLAIPVNEFAVISRCAASEPGTLELLEAAYEQDDNAVPSVYRLRAGLGSGFDGPLLARRLAAAAEGSDWSAAERFKYCASATEQEIVHAGLLEPGARDPGAFCFFRTIEGLPEDERGSRYRDLGVDGLPERAIAGRLEDLKQRLRMTQGQNVHEFVTDWCDGEPGRAYIDEFCWVAYERLSAVIEAEVTAVGASNPPRAGSTERHAAFAAERRQHFVGRTRELQTTSAYLRKAARSALLFSGAAGVGKTALMAEAAALARELFTNAEVVARFVGATPESSSLRALLLDLSRAIEERFGLALTAGAGTLQEHIELLHSRLALAGAERPLIVFVDALDQLTAPELALAKSWIPSPLPPHVWMVISRSSSGEASELPSSVDFAHQVELGGLTNDESATLVGKWLAAVGRTLQDRQLAAILAAARENPTPLYLRLLFEQAKEWRSSDAPATFARDSLGIFRDYLRALSQGPLHGDVLVSRSLGYLAAGRFGLPAGELQELLSRDSEVMAAFRARSPDSPAVDALPEIVWSRLYHDLRAYLVERDALGGKRLDFYHGTLRHVVEQDYLSEDRHQAIARYFGEQPDVLDEKESSFNLRRLGELPYHLASAGMWQEFRKTLLDYAFLRNKVAALGPRALIQDLELPAAAGSASAERTALGSLHTFEVLRDAFELSADALMQDPRGHFLSELWGRLQREPESEIENLLASARGQTASAWLRTLDQSLMPAHKAGAYILAGHTTPIRATFIETHGRRAISASVGEGVRVWDWASRLCELSLSIAGLESCTVSADGRTLFAGHDDGTLSAWSLENGQLRYRVPACSETLRSVLVTPDARHVLTSTWNRASVKVFDAVSGTELREVGLEHDVAHLALSREGLAVAGDFAGNLSAWQIADGTIVSRFEGHDDALLVVCAHPSSWLAISSDGRHRTKAWDVRTGELVFDLEQPIGFEEDELFGMTALAITPDGTKGLGACHSGHLLIWDLLTGKTLLKYRHPDPVSELAVSADGARAVSAADNALTLWDLETLAPIAVFEAHAQQIEALALAAHGGAALSGSTDGVVLAWEFDRRQVKTSTAPRHAKAVTAIAVSASLGRVVSTSRDETIKIWDSATGAQLFECGDTRGYGSPVVGLGLTRDGRSAITTTTFKTMWASLWDLETGARLKRFVCEGASEIRDTLVFDPAGNRMLAGCSDWGGSFVNEEWQETRKDRLLVWDTANGNCLLAGEGHRHRLRTIAVAADGTVAVSGSSDGSLIAWDLRRNERLCTLAGHSGAVSGVAVAANGSLVVSISNDGTLRRWHLPHGAMTFEWRDASAALCALLVSDDAAFTVCGSEDGRLLVWAGNESTHPSYLKGHSAKIEGLTLLPKGPELLSWSRDKTLKLWDLANGQLKCSFRGESPLTCCAIVQEGSYVCGEESGRVHFLKLEPPALI